MEGPLWYPICNGVAVHIGQGEVGILTAAHCSYKYIDFYMAGAVEDARVVALNEDADIMLAIPSDEKVAERLKKRAVWVANQPTPTSIELRMISKNKFSHYQSRQGQERPARHYQLGSIESIENRPDFDEVWDNADLDIYVSGQVEPGRSGSPIFNDKWQVAGVLSGAWLLEGTDKSNYAVAASYSAVQRLIECYHDADCDALRDYS